jgi:hypothetical protein
MAAPTLDGTASGQATNLTSYTITLTTTQANDIICVLIYSEGATTNPAPTITSVTASGLTFVRRAQSPGSHTALELWWAVASSALSSAVITINLSGTYDDSAAIAFGVNGCNLSSPWDSNAGLPMLWTDTSAGAMTPGVSSVNTSQANDFLIFACGSAAGWSSIGTVPTGFTGIAHRINAAGGFWASSGAAYQAVTTQQVNQSFAWGSSLPGLPPANDFIFDALTADAAAPTITARPQVFVCT